MARFGFARFGCDVLAEHHLANDSSCERRFGADEEVAAAFELYQPDCFGKALPLAETRRRIGRRIVAGG